MLFSVDDNRVHKDLKTAIKVFNVVSVRIWVRIRVRVKIRVRVTLIPMQMLPLMKVIESLRNTMHSGQCPERNITCMNAMSYHNIYMSKD